MNIHVTQPQAFYRAAGHCGLGREVHRAGGECNSMCDPCHVGLWECGGGAALRPEQVTTAEFSCLKVLSSRCEALDLTVQEICSGVA